MKTLVFAAGLTTVTQSLAVMRSAIRKLRNPGVLAIAAFPVFCLFGSAQSLAQNAYISGSGSVFAINTITDTLVATVPTPGELGRGVAVSPDGSRVYVTIVGAGNNVVVIDATSNTIIAAIPVEIGPFGVAVSPDGARVWVTTVSIGGPSSVTEIDAATNAILGVLPINGEPRGIAVAPNGEAYVAIQDINTVVAINPSLGVDASFPVTNPWAVAVSPDGSKVYVSGQEPSAALNVIDATGRMPTVTIPVGALPAGVAVSPDGSQAYVANSNSNSVSVINTAQAVVIATIPTPINPIGVSVTPDGGKVFVANGSTGVSVIDTVKNAVVATVPVGEGQFTVGKFIGPAPKFAGTPERANCFGVSVAALVQQYGGLSAAAAALGYPSVTALQNAIMAYCEG